MEIMQRLSITGEIMKYSQRVVMHKHRIKLAKQKEKIKLAKTTAKAK
jgi:hypothetical protein